MLMEWQLRRDVADTARKAYKAGFVTATDGNISVRTLGDRLFITPSGACLGEVNAADLLYMDFAGNVLSGRGAPSSELAMHLAVYRRRPDVHAVIHAHPVAAVACTVAGVSLEAPVIPEVAVTLRTIPTVEYATPSTDETARAVEASIGTHDAILLDRHGAVTVGKTLVDAYRKLEKVEYAARIMLVASRSGPVRTLTPEQLDKLRDVAAKLGLDRLDG